MTDVPSLRDVRGWDPFVRSAMESDLALVDYLDGLARSEIAAQKGGVAWIAEHGAAVDVLKDRECRTFVVEFCSVVVGFLVAEILEEPHRGRIMRIDRVYVEPEAREIGCGDALIAGTVEFALKNECGYIEGQALPGDRGTKNLYERAGITARLITVSKALSALSTEVPASR